MTDAYGLFVLLYGGVGGWLGIALSVYLSRFRPVPAHPVTVLCTFTFGFAMLMATLLISDVALARHVWLTAVTVTYTLMIVAELALFSSDVNAEAVDAVYSFVAEAPRFAHTYDDETHQLRLDDLDLPRDHRDHRD